MGGEFGIDWLENETVFAGWGMPDVDVTVRIVLTTVADAEDGRRLGRALVEERLVACVSLVPGVESIYRWKGEVESAGEVLLLIKTEVEQLAALEARLHELHSYETPEFLVLKVAAGSAPYLEWLAGSVGKAGTK